MKKNKKNVKSTDKKPFIIAGICTGAAALALGLGKAISIMKKSAKAQHEVDKAEFEAVKAESRANFEENRGHNTFAKAKADAKENWEAAKAMGKPSTYEAEMQAERDEKIAEAKARVEAANERYEDAKKK